MVSDAAAAFERRQKPGAILMSLSLLDSVAQGLRVEAENQSDRKLGQISRRALEIESAISSIDRGFCETIWISGFLMASLNWLRSCESAKIFSRIELTRRKAFGGPRLRQWRPYRFRTRIVATNAELPRLLPYRFSINRERVRSPACSITAQANRIPLRLRPHLRQRVTCGLSCSGGS